MRETGLLENHASSSAAEEDSMEGEDTTVNGDVGFDAAMGLGSKAKLPELNEADAEEERETDEREQRWKSVRGKFLGSIEFASRLCTN